MADQKIKIEITGFTYTQEGKIHVMIDSQNVQVKGVFWWAALEEFFNKEKNYVLIEQSALPKVPAMKEFIAEFEVELMSDVLSNIPDDVSYEIIHPIEFKVTGNYEFAGDENSYTEESI
jgi:hypothetical protein